MSEPFADACCPVVLAGRLPLAGAAPPPCGFFRGAWPAPPDGLDPPLAAAGGAVGFVVAAGPAEGGFADPGDFGGTDLGEVSLLMIEGLAGAVPPGGAVPPSVGAAPGTGAG